MNGTYIELHNFPTIRHVYFIRFTVKFLIALLCAHSSYGYYILRLPEVLSLFLQKMQVEFLDQVKFLCINK